jgi:excisionase family DNA binding protein
MKNPKTVSVPIAARQLGFTLKYVYDLVYSGRLKAEKIAGRWHIGASEVNALIAKRGPQ